MLIQKIWMPDFYGQNLSLSRSSFHALFYLRPSNVGLILLNVLTYLIICRILLVLFVFRLGLVLQILTCLHSPSCVIVWPLGQLSGIVTNADLDLI